jgi:DNA-directed RNA polymerase subunit omega
MKNSIRHNVDTDKCVENIGNRFDLVLAASIRVRELTRGSRKLVDSNSGNVITALKEIEEGKIDRDILRKIR